MHAQMLLVRGSSCSRRTAKRDATSATTWSTTALICLRPVGVIRSASLQMPQQSWSVVRPLQVARLGSAGGSGPGKPRAYHSPTWKQAAYGGAVSGSSEA